MAQRQHQHNTLASIKQHLRNYEQKFLGGAKYISARRKLNDLTKLALGGGAKWKWLVGKKNKRKNRRFKSVDLCILCIQSKLTNSKCVNIGIGVR